MMFFGIFSSVVISLGYFYLKDTNKFKNRIKPFLHFLSKKSQFKYNIDNEEAQIIRSASLTH